MDSINKQQPEENFRDVYGQEALDKIKELAEKAKSCLFCTDIETGKPFSTRPMAAEKIDEEGHFWFLSAADSHKNHELLEDYHAQLLFQGSGYSDFMSLYGVVRVSRDREKIDELWDMTMKTWFTKGKDDPRITVLEFIPKEGYYWDTKNGMAIAFAKRLVGAVYGKTFDDSIEGRIIP